MYTYLTFSIPNEFNNFFLKIIKDTNLEEQVVAFEDLDIINKDFDQNINIINDYHYKVKNIINDFNTTEYILFLKALFTSSNLNSCSTKISSLDKFLISEYSTIIFITDSTIVNIITKDEIISEQIINNAKKYKFQKIYSENNFLPYNIFEYN
ncbi:DUF2691 family protein [Ruminococcus bromii]|jgi:hypothetical protein|uniref:DUF2691 family protein n=1 Tax=Ruminococcus bromii TaxID=40518 RepID=A0ABT0NLP8_9FIRM|nr:DUF2691 family protein [Ruminococcus bromii]MCL3788499.1 DUF2691 family protein [Ruminococcus bromii]